MKPCRFTFSGFGVLSLLLLASCTGGPVLDAKLTPPERPRAIAMSPNVQREHDRILTAYGGAYENAPLEALLGRVVDKLVAASERPDLPYRVTILNSSAVNAFALPSGQLYVTRGLLALANDSSELASVLSHEMAHVIAQHAEMREDRVRQAAIVSRVVSDVLSDPQIGALALAKSKIALASFSRAQEFEADGIGVGIAARAGYDPYGAVRFLTAMGRNASFKSSGRPAEDSRPLDFLSSHPNTPERVRNAQVRARSFAAPGAGEREREVYLATVNGLVYGEDPSEGFVRGRRFLHPKLGFTFTAPEGFTLENTAQAVLGLTDDGNQALRFDVVRVASDQTLADYLKSGWIENISAQSVEAITLNGLPAATATAQGDVWHFRLYAVRFGSDVYRFIYATKHNSPDSDRGFRASVSSFRRMTLAEIEQARPLHLKTVTVQPGDTIERLASQMAIQDRAAERLAVLNGLVPGERLRPGETVKIVSE